MPVDGLEDLEPTPADPSKRAWTWPVFAAAWASMIVNPASFSGGAAILSLGLSVAETVLAQAVAALFLVIGLVLNGWAGTKYGIPFPVFARSSFGTTGAHFCTLTRGAVAIMWLSFQMWQGTLGIFSSLQRTFGIEAIEGWGRLGSELCVVELLIFAGFLLLHAVMVHLGPARLKGVIYVILPALLLGTLGLVIWASSLASVGQALHEAHEQTSITSQRSHGVAFMTAVNSSISLWSTLLLNVCDLSRFAPTQRDQIVGQALGLPLPFVITGFLGMWIAGATTAAYGTPLWQIPQCFVHWSPALSWVGSMVVAFAILTVNILANILSPINDLMNLAPKRFTFRCCGYLVLVLSALVCPWWTFSSRGNFVLTILNGYGMVTGAIAGVFLTDFWLLRGRRLDVEQLYSGKGGVNWLAMLAVLSGVAPCFPGFVDRFAGGDGSVAGYSWQVLYEGGSLLLALSISGAVYGLLSVLAAMFSRSQPAKEINSDTDSESAVSSEA
eukprot:gb/GFBE01042810.1/.p1 GENE.gb/GFBE01042810.1/~~gb/GFBE01042810.1/.p1  ORF type:complete len:499 (+),score=82.02 gb/GFBE01042810.1/:1-1497(+)